MLERNFSTFNLRLDNPLDGLRLAGDWSRVEDQDGLSDLSHLIGDRWMLDPFDNPETADASKIRGGRSGPDGRIGSHVPPAPVRPALHPAGAFVFLRQANPRQPFLRPSSAWVRFHGRPRLPSPALSGPFWPGGAP